MTLIRLLEGELLGRNFDWNDHRSLLLFTDPPRRYASVSLVDISYLGYSKNDAPDKNHPKVVPKVRWFIIRAHQK